jgi:uncharacterized protein
MDIETLRNILKKDHRIVFAYLYGSVLTEENYNDIDIAIYAKPEHNKLGLAIDIQILLYEHTGITADFFDVKIINDLIVHGDIFSLLYLKSVFAADSLILDNDFDVRADFLEAYSMKYRECEGFLDEVLL